MSVLSKFGEAEKSRFGDVHASGLMRTIHKTNVATVIKSWAAPIFIGLVIVTMFAMTHQMCAQVARIPAGKDGAAVSSCSPGLGEREGGHNHSASESRPNRQQ